MGNVEAKMVRKCKIFTGFSRGRNWERMEISWMRKLIGNSSFSHVFLGHETVGKSSEFERKQ
jgi:hypothetical protein